MYDPTALAKHYAQRAQGYAGSPMRSHLAPDQSSWVWPRHFVRWRPQQIVSLPSFATRPCPTGRKNQQYLFTGQ
jgi:hypothetical protein